MKLLIHPQVDDRSVARIRNAFPDLVLVNAASEHEAQTQVHDADVLYGQITPGLLRAAARLTWVQADRIGMEHYLFPELVRSQVILTNVRGVFSDHIADHVWAYILAFARGLHTYLRRQVEHAWRPGSETLYLPECTLGIIGLGGIGREVARRAPVFGPRVIAVDPRPTSIPDGVETVWPPERLDDLLRASDLVVICAPHTPGTEHMIGAAQLALMKPTAYLINIGRGVIVDLRALTDALRAGQLAGAALDVYEVEPLPAGHPLWDMEQVILTPHIAGAGPYVQDRRIDVFIENMRRYLAGQPMMTVVEKTQWF